MVEHQLPKLRVEGSSPFARFCRRWIDVAAAGNNVHITDEPISDREDEAEPGGNEPDEDYANAGDEPLPENDDD